MVQCALLLQIADGAYAYGWGAIQVQKHFMVKLSVTVPEWLGDPININ